MTSQLANPCFHCDGKGVVVVKSDIAPDAEFTRPCRVCGGDGETPRCLTCGRLLTSDDPAVTTLGPRCRRCW